ncbi:MAG: ATP-grasp domain-containing protein [Gemmatimonadetes bacterium]|uniref:ATP-grasp domain-containing protein n=1 Tax=Candidatus Kutchimonas denitrificans TaxID=3056748 RepID=A0AAE5CBV0_9BACT|nr:ATP-grasp domain-containing protein [Gemmatimonadota bacterium]NIR76322.1 ATP-grasp domain-containing protein [Candidatus Kutchimonas denitrificans]NIS02345.1 ATP-grasp domain-containing protein [Gemmatimonadota bacterium]NIT68164.1 ATP-grasp domain-containing protein [Gemmatimonadota bacterium]NIU54388.1 ATP-grasp domain-containing protein [Gemmatimonadota bacterium]
MKIAVVFDTPARGWEDADFKQEIAAEVYEPEYDVADALMENGHDVFLIGFHDNLRRMLDRLEEFEPELVFNCTESFMGRARYDYGVAALLEMKGYRYTGSSPEALLLARDKATSKKILSYHGVRVPRFQVYDSDRIEPPSGIAFPLIVKPMHEDASVGISQASVVTDLDGLGERVAFIHRALNQPAIAEELIEGRELYLGMIGNHKVQLLPTIEITFDRIEEPSLRIATYSAKWDLDYRQRWGIKNIFARRLGAEARKEMERAAHIAFHALGLRDYARIDFRLTRDQKVYLLEANPNPFIAFGEDMANAAERSGLDYYDFIERIVSEALKRYEAA